MHLNVSSAKWRLFCPGLNMLNAKLRPKQTTNYKIPFKYSPVGLTDVRTQEYILMEFYQYFYEILFKFIFSRSNVFVYRLQTVIFSQ